PSGSRGGRYDRGPSPGDTGTGLGDVRRVMARQLPLCAPRRRMPNHTAAPPTTTSAPATPAISPALEFAPRSARFDSPAGGDGAWLDVLAGAVLLLSGADGVGESDSAGLVSVADGDGVADGEGLELSADLHAVDEVVRLGEMFVSILTLAVSTTTW